jgi:catechol 2,3-dioxygenase-like lactoylglutathione lyase family enzyme
VLGDRPIAAFVATTRPDVAQAFYSEVLGLRLVERDSYALVYDAGGTMLRVVIVDSFDPQNFTVLGWGVPDIAASVRELSARGVEFKRFEWMQQDDLGIWHTPEGPQVAWFADPDGNTLSLTQF